MRQRYAPRVSWSIGEYARQGDVALRAAPLATIDRAYSRASWPETAAVGAPQPEMGSLCTSAAPGEGSRRHRCAPAV